MNPRIKMAGAIALLAGAIVLTVVRCTAHRRAARPSAAVQGILNALEEHVETEALPLAGSGGRVLLVGFRTPAIGDPGPVELMERLGARLRKAGLNVAPPVLVDVALDRLEMTGQALTGEDWVRLVGEHSDANLLVSLAGAPRLTAAQAKELPTPRPKILMVSETPTDNVSLEQCPLVDTLIYRRLGVQDGQTPYAVRRKSGS